MSLQRPFKKAFGGFSIALGTEHKVQGLALRIHGSVEICPLPFDFHVSLIHFPRVVRRAQMRATAIRNENSIKCLVMGRISGLGGDDRQGQIIVCKEFIKALIDPSDS